MKKLISILVAFAMMMALCVTAFAEDDPKVTTAPISKTLTVPGGTAIPAGSQATFTFTNYTVNGAAPEENDPTISTQTLNLATGGAKTEDATNNVDVYAYTIPDVLAGKEFSRPGVYEWDVVEATFTADDGDAATEDKLIKDETQYKMVVKVIYDQNGDLVIDEVIIKAGTDDPAEPGETIYNEADGLAFANAYYTTTGNDTIDPDDPTDPDDPVDPGNDDKDDAGLSVEKLVEGTYGDRAYPFEITVNLALPQIPGANEATAIIRRAADNSMENVTITNGDNVINLASGDKLVFTKIAEGTKYTVTETDALKGTDDNQYTATGEVTTATAVVKGANSATITNVANQDSVTPTGILLSNLPYILLAVVAAGGLIAYLMMKRREANSEA